MPRRLRFIWFSLLLPATAPAQVIGGEVRDYNSHLVSAGLLVEALDGKSVVARASTDSSGIFYVDVPRSGLYRLRLAGGTNAPFLSDTIRVAKDGFVQRRYFMDSSASRVYYEFELGKTVVPRANQTAPRYPADLREKGVSGQVMARFVVDTLGYAIDSTFAAIKATDFRFVDAVRDAVRNLSFYPGELINGRRVKQLVHMPFQFDMQSNAP